ncbi:MAG TPA: SDR family oxidoreductase [Candidatus Saccharimonadales bacterium]|jgi:3-oxoacyl-[acyl-carrier protein] reductase
MTLDGKVALVTGAGHGIGAAIAERLAKQGTRVAITYRNDEVGAQELVRKCTKDGAEMRAYHVTELADDGQCAKLFGDVLKDFGQLDIVVANASGAGGASGKEDLNDLDLDMWRENLKDDLLVAVTTVKYAIKALNKNSDGGKIVLIGSVLGLDGAGNPRITAYSAAKAATHNFGRTIAKVLAPKIVVNVVAPGRCWSKVYDTATKEEIVAKFAPNKHGRPIDGAEIAQAVHMVLENDSFIGQVINVEAGFTLINT